MRLITDALILRVGRPIGEADRPLTALTRERGILRANARGVLKVNNRNASATSLLSYARLTLVSRRDGTYIVTDAQPLRVFFELRQDIAAMALAQYLCELAAALCPAEERGFADADEPLRLMLNALHFLCEGTRPPAYLKALTELRLLCQAGYAPHLDSCARCGGTAADAVWLLPREGGVCCAVCAAREAPDPAAQAAPTLTAARVPLPGGALELLRLMASAPLERCFALQPATDILRALSAACEAYLLAQLGRMPPTLSFYQSLTET